MAARGVPTMTAFVLALALVSGVLMGCIGIGGVLLVPALSLVGVPVHDAIAASMLCYAFAGGIAVWIFAREGSIDWGSAGWLSAGAMPGAFAGAALANAVSGEVLIFLIALAVLFSGVRSLRGARAGVAEHRVLRQRARVVRGRSVIEELQHPLVAAVAVIEKQAAVAARRIDRLQDREIAGETDETLGVGRRLVDVGDAALRRGRRVDRKMRPPDEPFIRSGRAESSPSAKGKCSVIDSSMRLVIKLTSKSGPEEVNHHRVPATRISTNTILN